MTDTQQKILKYLKEKPTASLQEIADSLGCTRPNVHYNIGKLALAGRLKKIPGTPDRYEVKI